MRVYLEDEVHDAFLTEVIEHPELLRGDVSCLEAHHHFLLRSPCTSNSTVGQTVLVISHVLDKTKVAKILILLLVVSPAVGTSVGISSGRADVGVAASAGVFALAALLQGLAAWFHH